MNMSAIEVKSTLTMDQIERNFKDVDFFSSLVDGLQEARDQRTGIHIVRLLSANGSCLM